jgi:hypothetical protein
VSIFIIVIIISLRLESPSQNVTLLVRVQLHARSWSAGTGRSLLALLLLALRRRRHCPGRNRSSPTRTSRSTVFGHYSRAGVCAWLSRRRRWNKSSQLSLLSCRASSFKDMTTAVGHANITRFLTDTALPQPPAPAARSTVIAASAAPASQGLLWPAVSGATVDRFLQPMTSAGGPLACAECPETFFDERDLQEHMDFHVARRLQAADRLVPAASAPGGKRPAAATMACLPMPAAKRRTGSTLPAQSGGAAKGLTAWLTRAPNQASDNSDVQQ